MFRGCEGRVLTPIKNTPELFRINDFLVDDLGGNLIRFESEAKEFPKVANSDKSPPRH
jgi:hypothetical protein